ncbi:MAG: 50S ribosome-binding GTPase [Nanoarchaeota archaeon]|nr:50S ribosome-binding GTPase [Nanoarchaeota archaeon]
MVRVRYSFGCRHTGRIANIKKQRGKYPDVMKDVVRISDIVLEILDARFIEETRNLEVEEDVLKKGKILVYVINKSDLINTKELEKTLPKWMRPYVFVSATKGEGLKDLKARIKMEAKRILAQRKTKPEKKAKFDKNAKKEEKKESKQDKIVSDLESKKRIHVGVIGYPNAGKSSVINFITRRSVAKTAKQAGFTKGMQKIRMSEDILILDTPGVIPASTYSTETKTFAQDVKVGGRTYSDVKDPEDVVFYLISAPVPEDPKNITEDEQLAINEATKNATAIENFYGIEAEGNVEVLIEELGKKKGFLGKGGKVDVDRTSRIILRDWQTGEIKVN